MKLQAERTTLNALLSARYEPTAESAAILNFIVVIINNLARISRIGLITEVHR